MHEPFVTLTDYTLTLECAVLGTLLLRKKNRQPVRALFFFSIGFASLLGGSIHGFFPDKSDIYRTVLWKLTLFSIGITGLCGWVIGANLVLKEKFKVPFATVALALFFFYVAYLIITPNPGYYLAIIYYLPPSLFLLGSLIYQWLKKQDKVLISGIYGFSLTFIAAGLQQAKVMIHPVYINHNVLYHILQGIALWLIYRTFQALRN